MLEKIKESYIKERDDFRQKIQAEGLEITDSKFNLIYLIIRIQFCISIVYTLLAITFFLIHFNIYGLLVVFGLLQVHFRLLNFYKYGVLSSLTYAVIYNSLGLIYLILI